MSGQSTSQALGCRISLTSNSEIRYEGFLFAIDEQANTVSLMNVRMFGTEGRRGNPGDEVSPGECLYEHLVFSGADIKDLTVYEEAPLPKDPAILSGKAANAASAAAAAGAPVGSSSSHNSGQHHKKSNETRNRVQEMNNGARQTHGSNQGASDGFNGRGRGRGASGQAEHRPRRRHDGNMHHGYHQDPYHMSAHSHGHDGYGAHNQGNSRNGAPIRGGRGGNDARGGYDHRAYNQHHGAADMNGGRWNAPGGQNGGYRRRRGGNGPSNGGGPRSRRDRAHTGQDFEVATDAAAARAEFQGDFDFVRNNEKLITQSPTETAAPAAGKAVEDNGAMRKGYDKTSSFFDTISCDAREKRVNGPGEVRGRMAREERENAHKIDLETFGTELVQSQRRDGHGGPRRGGYNRRR